MASNRKTWLWVLFGVLIVIALCVIGVVAGGAYWMSTHFKTELVGRTSAEEEFGRQRERFANQQPLLELKGDPSDQEVTVHRPAGDAPKVELQTMRVLVYDEHEGRLVRVEVPFWLLRLMPSGRISNVSAGSGFSLESSRITVDDLERHGPGLILDAHDARNARILIWTE
jgi:hypothetical protein